MDVEVVLFRSQTDCSELLTLNIPETATVGQLRDSVTQQQQPSLVCVAVLQDGKRCSDDEPVIQYHENGKGLIAFLRPPKQKASKSKAQSSKQQLTNSQASQAATQQQEQPVDPKATDEQVSALILSWLTNDAGLELMSAAPLVNKIASLDIGSEDDLWGLTKDQINSCVSHAAQRKKIIAAIKRGKVEPKPSKKRRGANDDEPRKPILPPGELKPHECCGVVMINRSPVMILWSAVVAKEVLNYDWESALSLGSTVSALNARAKHSRIWGGAGDDRKSNNSNNPHNSFPEDGAAVDGIMLLGREVPACKTDDGVRGCISERAISARSVDKSLRISFSGQSLAMAYGVMVALARVTAAAIRRDSRTSYSLYERFRPSIPDGAAGWGAPGALDLDLIRSMVDEYAAGELEAEAGPAGELEVEALRPRAPEAGSEVKAEEFGEAAVPVEEAPEVKAEVEVEVKAEPGND